MQIKILRFYVRSGFVIFTILLLLNIFYKVTSPHLVVSSQFQQDILSFDLILSIYISVSLLLAFFTDEPKAVPVSTNESRAKLNIPFKKIGGVSIALFLGWLIYTDLTPSLLASYFHHGAPKENIAFSAVIHSVGKASIKEFQQNCPYHIYFDTPEISASIQYVCVNSEQWLYFRNTEKPFTVDLYGKKSYFGFELQCCK
ncbi:MAG: hypothetical protein HZB50_00175 [Chloroflexi bacterium]|nr:hypothetical protein [Chloroflexota bacterium]